MLRSIEGETAEQLKYWPRPSPLGFFRQAAAVQLGIPCLSLVCELSQCFRFDGDHSKGITKGSLRPLKLFYNFPANQRQFVCEIQIPLPADKLSINFPIALHKLPSRPARFPMTESSATEKEIRRDKECKHSPPPNFILARRL